MKRSLILLLTLLLSCVGAYADGGIVDNESQLRLLAQWVQKARAFDNAYTREKVYLHLDNNAYFEGETIWFKAYVMRASTLCPDTALSRVLYVDLLDSRGETVEQKLVHIDEFGQGEGEFDLQLPVRSGYYELRAYTRAMTNWGAEACFSRVVPVFRAKDQGSDPSLLNIDMPDNSEEHFTRMRPRQTSKAKGAMVEFYPEGGNRVGGVEQRIAYRMTDGKGSPLSGRLAVRRADGTLITESEPYAEGMGVFTLPKDIPADEPLYALNNAGRFTLPAVEPQAQYALAAQPGEESFDVFIRANADSERLLGLLISCRAAPTYFDTIHVYRRDDAVMTLSNDVLHDGVNTIDLFDEEGHSLCRRLIWKRPDGHRCLDLEVRQNAPAYDAFAPIALDMLLTDNEGYSVRDATFSISVRNAAADIVAAPGADLATELLLSSEVRGYVNHPEQFFAADDAAHRDALDALLMVQGWTAVDFATISGAEPFVLRQPLEDKLMLTGTVYKDNDKHEPYANLDLHLQMYTREGASLESSATTDAAGRFSFESSAEYCGEWIAQLTTDETVTNRHGDEKQKRRWSRIAFDRWFAPKLRPYDVQELVLISPFEYRHGAKVQPLGEDELFEWTDTIQRVLISQELREATAVHHNGYRGLVGNRYTYNGGEEAGMRRASLYINVGREDERRKDAGLGEGSILDILSEAVDRKITMQHPVSGSYDPMNPDDGEQKNSEEAGLSTLNNLKASGGNKKSKMKIHGNNYQPADYVDYANITYMSANGVSWIHNSPVIEINNKPCIFFLNNELVGYGYGNSLGISESDLASEYKSAVIMTERKDWMRFWPLGLDTPCPESYNPYYDGKPYYAVFLYNREDPYRYYTKKGVDKRILQGYSVPKKFYAPQYNGMDLPDDADLRRTLCWNPNVTTDAEGHASLVFFNNAVGDQRIAISVRGITKDGELISFDR